MTNAQSKPIHPYSATIAKARDEALARGDEYYTIAAGVDQLNCIAAEATAQGDIVEDVDYHPDSTKTCQPNIHHIQTPRPTVEDDEDCPQLIDTNLSQTNTQHDRTPGSGPALSNFDKIALQLGELAQHNVTPTPFPSDTGIVPPEDAFRTLVNMYRQCKRLVDNGASAEDVKKLTALMMVIWERSYGPIFHAGLRVCRIKLTTAILALVGAALIVSLWRL
ncbi:uncharacterized protein AB675_8292 [Cyphellophora attinorum]|uniref:Uncharacterized protein n=1 Tax=Cyphellophora attinorum TaxID=1664694 RepID=A0A0N1HFZ6_9EURO|nr:uncharacterized protein AB675_8292 [Phialophora attinorum]KPI44395.1 hypothetical protein AB675_8292 [Phialophora attinorum]